MTSSIRHAGTALALSLAAMLAGCGGIPTNSSLESIHQPVVERVNYTLDVATGAGGLSYPEQQRVAEWFEAMDLRYGDRIAVDDPLASDPTRSAIAGLAARYGLTLSAATPVTQGYVGAGTARIIVSRSQASVPGCPDWASNSDFNPKNATHTNYGCAVNSNLAAMVANPEHLLRGEKGTGENTLASSNKAIGAYRDKAPTGSGSLKTTSSKGE